MQHNNNMAKRGWFYLLLETADTFLASHEIRIAFSLIIQKHETPHLFEKRGFSNLFMAPPLQEGLRLFVNLLTMAYLNMLLLVLPIP
jgi:hypothetical protein